MSRLIVATEALADRSVTRRELGRSYTMIHRNVYAPNGTVLTARDRALAGWLWSGRTATVAGLSAAALLGSRWVPDDAAAELLGTHHRGPPGIVVHSGEVADDEIRMVGSVGCTTVARTAYDLGRRLPFVEGVLRVDALLNATGIPLDDVHVVAARYPGGRGIRRLRRVLDVADGGAESPQESRVRLILVKGGLPRPVTRIKVGRRRIDMGWPQWQVGVEYDGVQHWADPLQHGGDIERLEFFDRQGWRIVCVVAAHLRSPQEMVRRSRSALQAAGWPG